jgi:hypothetical protein
MMVRLHFAADINFSFDYSDNEKRFASYSRNKIDSNLCCAILQAARELFWRGNRPADCGVAELTCEKSVTESRGEKSLGNQLQRADRRKCEMLQGRLRTPENKMETVKRQLRTGGKAAELNLGWNGFVTAARVFEICSLIMLALQIFGAAISALPFFIAAKVGGPMSMISTSGYARRRGDASSELTPNDFAIRPARIVRKALNTDARVTGRFTRFDLARKAICGNRFSSKAEASSQTRFAHHNSADAGSSTRNHSHIRLSDCEMNATNTGSLGNLQIVCGVELCRFDSNDWIMTGSAAKRTTSNAATTYSEVSREQLVLDRSRPDRRERGVSLVKDTPAERQVIRITA